MSRSRAWAITIAIAIAIWLIFATQGPGLDFLGGYSDLARGADLSSTDFHVFAPPWLGTLLTPFVLLPDRVGFALFLAFTLGMLLFSTYIFKGKTLPLLISAQLAWILWWGQIDALAISGLAIAWIAHQRKSWMLMTGAFFLVLLKPQISLIPFLLLWWWLGVERWKTLWLSASLILISLFIWGPWPLWSLSKIMHFTRVADYEMWNTSLGWMALPLFIPAILMPLKERSKRLLAFTATAMLISPYLPYYSTLILFCFPLPGWVYPFALLGYFPNLVGTEIAWKGITLFPVCVLLSIYQEPILRSIQQYLLARKISLPSPWNLLLGNIYSDESHSPG